jgi:phosphoglycolate phosphatase
LFEKGILSIPVLLLFDIDGTLLLKASREHAESIYAALRRIHHLHEVPEGKVEAAGRTDGAIARSILTLAGVPAEKIDDHARDVNAMAGADYAHRCPEDLSDRLSPGIVDVLDQLSARDDLALTLLTGNIESIARLKVERAGIGGYFPRGQGAYGSDSEDRAELPEIARRRAASLAGGGGGEGGAYPREKTVVIGDTPRDIACARADGVHVIAIATGPFGVAELAGADIVIETAREIPGALARIAAG